MAIPGLSRPKRTTTTEQAYEAILAAITDGSLAAGTPLRLQALAEGLDMSIMPIREAIQRLESLGVVESEPHRGAHVRFISNDELGDIYLARIVQEGSLVRLAATRFTEEAAEEAASALAAQQEALDAGDIPEARAAHQRFHFRIYEAAECQWLMRSVMPSWHSSERYRAASTADPSAVCQRRQEHERILRACIDHDPGEAYQALKVHLLATVDRLVPEVAQELKGRLLDALPEYPIG